MKDTISKSNNIEYTERLNILIEDAKLQGRISSIDLELLPDI